MAEAGPNEAAALPPPIDSITLSRRCRFFMMNISRTLPNAFVPLSSWSANRAPGHGCPTSIDGFPGTTVPFSAIFANA